MAVTNLRCAATVPLERFVGGRRHRRVVTLDHGHLVARAPEFQGGREAGHTATDHHDAHRGSSGHGWNSRPSKSPLERQRSMYWK